MCGKTKKDKIRNDRIYEDLGIVPIDAKLRVNRLRWFQHVHCHFSLAPVRRCDQIQVENGRRNKGRLKMK